MKIIAQPATVIALSALASMLLAADGLWFHVVGAGLFAILLGAALISFWLGLLALIPMLFAINPAPASIGIAEGAFALLAAVSLLGWLLQEIREGGWSAPVRRYLWPVAAALVWALINLYMARQNAVPFGDWVRGIVPFLFLLFALPFTYALAGQPERLKWVGLALATYTLLLMGQIVGYYIIVGLYKPYWLVGEGSSAFRITAEQLKQYPDAAGPYITRITIVLVRSTTVLMGTGLTMAFVVATLAESSRVRFLAAMLAGLCLTAELITYTRSMLVASAMTVVCFIILLAVRNRQHLGRALVLVVLLVAWSATAVWLFDMGTMWNYRLSETAQALTSETGGRGPEARPDENITSRLQELHLAWDRFKEHPLLGNGLGIKNTIKYVGNNGPFEVQVAYIHNWFFYALMVGGVLGWSLFVVLLGGPILSRLRLAGRDLLAYEVVRFGMLSFAVYGLTFAVFRHIDFNMLVAAAWGITFAARTERKA